MSTGQASGRITDRDDVLGDDSMELVSVVVPGKSFNPIEETDSCSHEVLGREEFMTELVLLHN
jgi:hypothetical protein